MFTSIFDIYNLNVDKENLKSWGNNFEKIVNVNPGFRLPGIDFGNQNSYGDAFMPFSNTSFKVDKNTFLEKEFTSASTELKEYLLLSDHSLFGIPGRNNVTVGGAIAADTHGKDNLWGGSFGRNIDSIILKLPSGEVITASSEQNFEIFESTIGGYGLTGSILGCKFKKEIKKNIFYIKETNTGKGVSNLINNKTFDNNSYWVGWINLLDKNFPWVSDTYYSQIDMPGGVKKNTNYEFSKFNLSFLGKNSFNSMKMINNIYFLKNQFSNKKIVSSEDMHYPLGAFSDTRNIAKNRKIIQIQFSIPHENRSNLEELINLLIYKQTPVLCSIKRLGKNNLLNNLSFYQNGWTLAVDFSLDTFDFQAINTFISKLIELEGKIYLAKDSILSESQFKKMYTNFQSFQKTLKKIDPDNIYQSEMSKRLGIKNW